MKQSDPTKNPPTDLKKRVFSEIQTEGVAPRPRFWFLCENSLVWLLWALSIVVGALSVAVLLFVSTYRYVDVYEATHDSFATFILESLPFIWFGVFVAMLSLAAWQLKHTKRGYRLSAPVLGVSSFAFSIVLGGLFHLGGFGWSLDQWLGEHAPMYTSQAKMEQKMWQNPDNGRLIGVQTGSMATTGRVSFVDMTGTEWSVATVDLPEDDIRFLDRGDQVRMVGVASKGQQFHACDVFPWMLGKKPANLDDMSAERRQFVDRMYKHYENAEARKKAVDSAVVAQVEGVPKDSPCHRLPAVRRVFEQMQ